MQNSSEQWKSGGDCGQCRREKYCGTKCRAHREYVKQMQDEALQKAIDQIMRPFVEKELKEEAEVTAEQEESIPAKEAEN